MKKRENISNKYRKVSSNNKKPKILIILPDRLNKPVGGLGVQCKHMIESLRDDFDFDIIGHPDPEASQFFTSVYNPLPNVGHASLITAVGQIEYFAEAIKRPKPDIVHAYDWSTYLSGVYTARFFNVPLVVTMQLSINLLNKSGIFYAEQPNTLDGFSINKVHTESEIFGLNNANKIIHVSNAYAEEFNKIAEWKEKSVVVPNGIDLEEWKNFEKIELPGNQKYKIVYIGRIALMKNFEALLKAKVPNEIDLIFVGNNTGGEGFVFDAMKNFVAQNENVHYYGPAYGQDKINLLMSADAVIMPSKHEPFGIVALEALASKSILLSSFEGGMKDFLTEDVAINCGIYPETIEDAYNQFLDLSEKEKKERIRKGLKICKEYSWEKASNKLKIIYLDLTSNI